MRGNPPHFENVCRPFRNIGCTTLCHDGSQGYYHRYGQLRTGTSLWGMLCVFSSLQCTGRGHAQNLFTSRFALFQCILHAQVSGLVPRYRTKSGLSRLISLYKPLLIVFSHIRNRGGDRKFISTMIVMHIELVIKSDTTRAGFIFADFEMFSFQDVQLFVLFLI